MSREPAPFSGPARRPFALSRERTAGLALVVFALFTLWAGRDLPFMTRGGVGSGLMPRALGVLLLGLCLVQLVLSRRDAEPWEGLGPIGRGAPLIAAALLFAASIRGMEIGPIHLPALGLLVAGPLAVILSGLAAPDARLKELLIFAPLITGFCILLFRFALGLSIPVAPWLIGY